MMTKEVFRIMMAQSLHEWVNSLMKDEPDFAFDAEMLTAAAAVRQFLAWYDKKEMEL